MHVLTPSFTFALRKTWASSPNIHKLLSDFKVVHREFHISFCKQQRDAISRWYQLIVSSQCQTMHDSSTANWICNVHYLPGTATYAHVSRYKAMVKKKLFLRPSLPEICSSPYFFNGSKFTKYMPKAKKNNMKKATFIVLWKTYHIPSSSTILRVKGHFECYIPVCNVM